MTVSVARTGDVDALVELVAAFRDHLGAKEPTDAALRGFLPELLADPATELSVARDDAGAPVGYASCRWFVSLWATGEEAHLEDLFVVERARGAGVGRALMSFVLDRAVGRGCAAIGLHTNERNERAQAFYRSMDFAPATEMRWDGGREVYWARDLAKGDPGEKRK